MVDEKNLLERLGNNFEHSVIKLVLDDEDFYYEIIDYLDPNYFSYSQLKNIVFYIKEFADKFSSKPTYNNLREFIHTKFKKQDTLEMLISVVDTIEKLIINSEDFYKEQALKFFKLQKIKVLSNDLKKELSDEDIEKYPKIISLLNEALKIDDNKKENGKSVFDDLELIFEEESRKTITTGIEGIDEIMNGGLARGELGVILAPFGVGKSTMVTKMANSAYNAGYNVLQIFFEDTVESIRKKHVSCWTGINMNELPDNKEVVRNKISEYKDRDNILILKKFSAVGTTVESIRNFLKQQKNKGITFDILFLDYIDCIQENTRHGKEEWSNEGIIMRKFEALIEEFHIAGWTCMQAGRGGVNAEIVDATHVGGSIKKAQFAHFIMSIAKTMEQKEFGRATLSILKSRFGRDGMILENILFDNGTLEIDTSDVDDVTIFKHKENKQEAAKSKASQLMQSIREANS